MEIILELPKTPRLYDHVFVVVDRINKMTHFLSCRQTDVGESSGVRETLYCPKIFLEIFYVQCVVIFGYPFGSNKGSNSHSSTSSFLG